MVQTYGTKYFVAENKQTTNNNITDDDDNPPNNIIVVDLEQNQRKSRYCFPFIFGLPQQPTTTTRGDKLADVW